MWKACFLLDVSNLSLTDMEALLDKERLLKYQAAKGEKVRRLSLGAGLLLRLVWGEAWAKRCVKDWKEPADESGIMTQPQVLERLKELPHAPEPSYCYGERGKPYFKDSPISFSLSHSGDLVLCTVADHEIGADLQIRTEADWTKLSKRYFPEKEQEHLTTMLAISEESAREEFFRLWCRKEAYGKMTGEGAAPYLKRSMLEMPKGFMAWDKAFTLRGVKYFQSIIETCVEEK